MFKSHMLSSGTALPSLSKLLSRTIESTQPKSKHGVLRHHLTDDLTSQKRNMHQCPNDRTMKQKTASKAYQTHSLREGWGGLLLLYLIIIAIMATATFIGKSHGADYAYTAVYGS